MSRWVRLQTSVFSHEIFPRETFSQREAWIWLIANAAWKDTTHRVGNTVVEVPAGAYLSHRCKRKRKYCFPSCALS